MSWSYVITEQHYHYKIVDVQVEKFGVSADDASKILTDFGKEGWYVKFVLHKYSSPSGTNVVFLLEKLVYKPEKVDAQ